MIDTVSNAFVPFAGKLLRPVSREDIERLLEIRIKRISRYDIDKQKKAESDKKNFADDKYKL